MGLNLSGDFRRPLSEVQRDRETGVLPTPTPGEAVDLAALKAEIKAEMQAENDELKSAINQLTGAEEVLSE